MKLPPLDSLNEEHYRKKLQGKKVTENIVLCPDGFYRWYYEFHMLKNPTILITVWKVLLLSFFIVFLFVFSLNLIDGNLSLDMFRGKELENTVKDILIGLGFILFFMFLSVVAYIIVAARNDWKYIVLFEMNDEGITHTQLKSQFKKQKALAWLVIMAGILSKSPSTAGLGIHNATVDSISSTFKKVKNIKVSRTWNVIKVNEILYKNQIYAGKEDFDFVLNYIMERIPESAKPKTKV